jgi:ribosomal-protein-serine acetyltransferase
MWLQRVIHIQMQSIVVSNEILLERISINDAATIFNAIDQNRSHLGAWLPFVDFTNTVKDTETFIHTVISHREETRNELYTIWFKGNFAGLIGFNNTDKVNEKTEIGYWLTGEMTGQGIIRKCCLELIGLAFEKMGMNRLTIRCAIGNSRSEKVARSMGFSFEGIERNGERHHDLFFDLKVFSLLKSEFLP